MNNAQTELRVGCNLKLRVLALAVATCFTSGTASANPTGATVTSGSAAISSAGSTLTVRNTPNSIINWHNFSINSGEITQFIQQSAASAVLNRITGGDPSLILGTLQSNGRVFLINPSGIVFGAGSVVNVAGLVASTLNITDADFLAGKHIYNANIANPGNVTNAGEIHTPSGGFVYLIGTKVENSGVINTPSGEAILAAGHSVEVVDSTDPSQHVLVSAQSQDVNLSQLMLQNDGNIFGVLNSGRVSANTVTQDASGRIYFKSAGNIETTADSITEAKGTATLDGGHIQAFANLNGSYSGTFDASGRNGGFIETSAGYLDISGINLSLGALDASGKGGNWLLDPNHFVVGPTEAGDISGALTSGVSITIDTQFSTYFDGANTIVASSGTDDIVINNSIISANASTGFPTLTLTAGSNIMISSGVQITGGVDIIMSSGNTGLSGGDIILGTNSVVGSNIAGATVSANAKGSIVADPTSLIAGSSVSLSATQNITAYVDTPVLTAASAGGTTPNSSVSITANSALDSALLLVTYDPCALLSCPTRTGSATLSLATSPNTAATMQLIADTVTLNGLSNPISLDNATIDLVGSTINLSSAGDLTLGNLTTINGYGDGGPFLFTTVGTLTIDGTSSIVGKQAGTYALGPGFPTSGTTLTTINANSISMDAGSIQTESGDLIINDNGALDLANVASITSAGAAAINAGSLTLSDSTILAIDALTLNVSGNASLLGSEIEGDIINSGALTHINVGGNLSMAAVTTSGVVPSAISAGDALNLDVTGVLSLDSSIIDSGGASLSPTTIHANSVSLSNSSSFGSSISAQGALTLTAPTSITLTNSSDIIAGNTTNISTNGAFSLSTSSFVTGNSNQILNDTTTVTASSVSLNTAQLYSPEILNVNTTGNISAINNSSIYGGTEAHLNIGGTLNLDTSLVGSLSPNTIYLYFPNLFTGGFTLTNGSGFFVGPSLSIPAILNSNLFISYGLTAPPSSGSSGSSSDGTLISIISQNSTNTLATNPYLNSYGPNQTGPGDSSYTYGVIGDPRMFGKVRECS